MSLYPSSGGQFYRNGLGWFVRILLETGVAHKIEDVGHTLDFLCTQAVTVLSGSNWLTESGIDFTSMFQADESTDLNDLQKKADAAIAMLETRQHTEEFWAYRTLIGVGHLRRALETNNISDAVISTLWLDIARTLFITKTTIEPTLWRGYSVNKLEALISTWESNHQSSDEAFWQRQFSENSLALSQLFALPVFVLQERAYLGGTQIDLKGGNIVDFLVKHSIGGNTALIEIKTPVTRLLAKTPYRPGIFRPSSDLSGAIVQLENYRHNLVRNSLNLNDVGEPLNPECILIIGSSTELTEDAQRKSFELVRGGLRNIRITTFDELFYKMNDLVKHLS